MCFAAILILRWEERKSSAADLFRVCVCGGGSPESPGVKDVHRMSRAKCSREVNHGGERRG